MDECLCRISVADDCIFLSHGWMGGASRAHLLGIAIDCVFRCWRSGSELPVCSIAILVKVATTFVILCLTRL